MENDEFIIKITPKGKKMLKEVECAYQEWLKESSLSDKQLMEYKNVKGFHIIDRKEGIALGYYDENQTEQMIGSGIYRECFDSATWIFAYICAKLDKENNYKSNFSKVFTKWGKRYDKRRK